MLPIPPNTIDADHLEPVAPIPSLDQSISPTRQLPQIFSDHERARSLSPQLTASEKEPSLLGTSAPLVTNPSLTDFLSNYPIWPTATQLPLLSVSTDSDDPHPSAPVITSALSVAGTSPSPKGKKGRPPTIQKRRLVQPRARTRKKKTPRKVAESDRPTASEAPRYQLRSKRRPRYKCGTCGLRDCVCLLAVSENRGFPLEPGEFFRKGEKQKVWCIASQSEPRRHSAVERFGDHPLDTILQKLMLPGAAKVPCPRFKEWSSDGKRLEITLGYCDASSAKQVCLWTVQLSARACTNGSLHHC